MPLAATAPKAPTNGNPWGFPQLDPKVARATLDGLKGTEKVLNRLIDRGIEVRVMLDRDLKAGKFSSDTVRAVNLLTRARDYGIQQIEGKHLPEGLKTQLDDWRLANKQDDRLSVVSHTLFEIEHGPIDFLDDDEGNVRDSIASMKTDPGKGSWQAVRDSLDGALSATYALRDSFEPTRHVVHSAGLYKD